MKRPVWRHWPRYDVSNANAVGIERISNATLLLILTLLKLNGNLSKKSRYLLNSRIYAALN